MQTVCTCTTANRLQSSSVVGVAAVVVVMITVVVGQGEGSALRRHLSARVCWGAREFRKRENLKSENISDLHTAARTLGNSPAFMRSRISGLSRAIRAVRYSALVPLSLGESTL